MGRYERAADGLPPLPRARRPRAARPLQAGARLLPQRRRPRSRSSRCAARWRSTIDSPKRTTCSALCLKDQKRPCRGAAIADPRARAQPGVRRRARRTGRRSNSPRARPAKAIEQLEALAALEPTRPQRLVDVGLAYARARTDRRGDRDAGTRRRTLSRGDCRLHRARTRLARRRPKRTTTIASR